MSPGRQAGAARPALHPPSDVNPYTRHVHDFPELLLPEPDPDALRKKLERSGRPPALAVDLGCGSGNFLLEMAARHPETRFVGFELRYKRLVKAARKLERAGLTNAWLLRDRAERFPLYFDPDSLEAVYLNFPDPWPKPSQWKHRLVNPAFLEQVWRLLVPGGRFHFKTDHSGYFLHVLSLLPGARGFAIRTVCNDFQRSRHAGAAARSEFEQLFHVMRKPVFYLVLDKPAPKR